MTTWLLDDDKHESLIPKGARFKMILQTQLLLVCEEHLIIGFHWKSAN